MSTKAVICTPIAGQPILPKPQCIFIMFLFLSIPNLSFTSIGIQSNGNLTFLIHLSISSVLFLFLLSSSSSPVLAKADHNNAPNPNPPNTTPKADIFSCLNLANNFSFTSELFIKSGFWLLRNSVSLWKAGAIAFKLTTALVIEGLKNIKYAA